MLQCVLGLAGWLADSRGLEFETLVRQKFVSLCQAIREHAAVRLIYWTCQMVLLVSGLFATVSSPPGTFRRLDISRSGRFAPDHLPPRRFATGTVRPHTMDDSPPTMLHKVKVKSFLVSFFDVKHKGTLNKCEAHENSYDFTDNCI